MYFSPFHSFTFSIFLFRNPDYQHAGFVQQPDWQRHHEQCKYVGCRSDDCRHYDDCNYCVAPVTAHPYALEQPEACKKPAYDRYLEHNAEHEAHHGKRVYIRADGQQVMDVVADLVGSEETDGQRKDDKVVDGHSEEKHQVRRNRKPHRISPLVVVQRWRNEAEQQVKDVRRGDEYAGNERHFHVYHELLGKPGVHQLYPERFNSEKPICDEIATARRKYDVKQPILKQKRRNSRHYSSHEHAYQAAP